MSEEAKTAERAAQLIEKLFSEIIARKDRDGIRSVYVNLVQFEMSDLDLKMLLGQVSQLAGNRIPEWHTAATMTWAEAKLLSFFLRINLAIYEAKNGTIKIPESLHPPAFPPPPDDSSAAQKGFELAQVIYRELMAEQAAL